jgi:hypothetical protein
MPEIKRVNYFNQQFLTEKEFKDEQAYHLGMRRRHNRELHTWGVAEGFEVEQQGPTHLLIRPGFAIDRHGREIVLGAPEDRDVGPFGRGVRVFVSVQYTERMEEEDRTGTAIEGYTRVTEGPDIVLRKQEPESDDLVPLAVVTLDGGGRIESIDPSPRRVAGPYLAPGSIMTEHLADGSITPQKLSRDMELVSGWVRHCFKPHPEEEEEEGKPQYAQYRVGPTEAAARAQLTKGSMGIVLPPGAKRVLELTVAGRASGSGVTAVLYRCGWNPAKSEHDRDELVRLVQNGEGKKGFCITSVVPENKRELDTRYNALAISIESTMAKISLVAVRVEYRLDG